RSPASGSDCRTGWLDVPAGPPTRRARSTSRGPEGGRWAPPGRARTGHRIPFPLVTLTTKPVQYKGDDLDPEKGPGLGCFRFQLVILAIFIVLTPLSVAWQWPDGVSAALLFAVL